ncbi:MAG: cell division protein FtsQ/DivIB [Verrucomicrobiaceae bacterium]
MLFTKRTSRRTSKSRDRMLELRVSSPRILFCDAVKMSGKLFKYLVILAMVGALGYGVRIGWEKLFIENDEFAIREMPLTTMEGHEPMFMTRNRVTEMTGIDPAASIFAFDIDEMEAILRDLPETSGARVTRRLPGTLKVEVSERIPVAWVACPALGLEERNIEKGLLVDESGVAFPCATPALAEYAAHLPVVYAEDLPAGAIVEGEKIDDEGLSYALEFARAADLMLTDADLPDWVMVRDGITVEMKTLGGTRLIASYFEQEKQLEKFQKLSRHARNRGRELATVNLIPERYVPVTYQN